MAIEKTHYEVIIVGSGPAGLTAAIYAARADLKPLVIEGIQPGGQLTITTDVENYPGFPKGIMGPLLMDEFRSQAERFGTVFITDVATEVDTKQRPFKVSVGKDQFTADSLIISTGATARLMDLPNESRLMGHGVSACATCDGWFFREKEIVVIGGGDSACEEADFLTKFASKVTLIHRRDELRASKIMQQRVFDNKKIEILWNHTITDYVGDGTTFLTGVNIKNTQSGEESVLDCQGAFLAIGHNPNSELFVGQIDLDSDGYILTQPDTTKTNVPGVFACGDIQDTRYKQAITAAGSGCMSAIDAEKYLSEQEEN